MNELKKAGFAAPSPIQAQAWPAALLGRDLVAVSATGSGKTIGFSIPAMVVSICHFTFFIVRS